LYQFNVHTLCNGVIAGLVSVTASCGKVELWSAAIIGMIGSFVFLQTKNLVTRFEIDDPLDISEIHGFCGIWSILAVGIFDIQTGLIYTGAVKQLGVQFVGAVAYAVWAALLSFMFFYSLKAN